MYTPFSTASVATADHEKPPSEREQTIGLRDIGSFFLEYAGLIVISAILFTTLAGVYIYLTVPRFTSVASVMIDTNRPPSFFQETGRADVMTDQARVENQIEIIKSSRIASIVIAELRLGEDSDLAVFAAPLVERIRLWLASWTSDPEDDAAAVRQMESIRGRMLIARFAERLNVRRVGQSMVIDLSFTTTDPVNAARIVNAIAEAYVRENVEAKSQLAQRRGQWLLERLTALQEQSFEAARAVERFKLVGEQGPPADVRAKLAELESVSQSYRRMYDGFLQQYTETVQRITYPEPDARIVAGATIPLGKSHPKRGVILGFGLAFGLAAGTALALARRMSDRRVRSPQQIAREIGIDCLGAVSRLKRSRKQRRAVPLVRAPKHGMSDVETIHFVWSAMNQASSPFINEIRELKASLNTATTGRKSYSIGVVAPADHHGATTIAAALAFLYARAGTRTLLVDACNARPTLTRGLSLESNAGLMQALDDAEALDQTLASQAQLPLVILPIGKTEGPITAGDRIGSERSAIQIDDFKERFDLVLFDLPSLCSSPDARTIGPYLDGIVLVVDFDTASTDRIYSSLTSLVAARANVLGVALNNVPARVRAAWLPWGGSKPAGSG